MKYLTTILLCLGISRSELTQSFFPCGSQQTSIQFVAVSSCCRNNSNGAYRFENVYMVPGPAEGCSSISPYSNIGVSGCGSSCAQPIRCAILRQFTGGPNSRAPHSSCKNCCSGYSFQPISSDCSGYSNQRISPRCTGPAIEPVSLCSPPPIYQPISSCCYGLNIAPTSPGIRPPVQPLYQVISRSVQQNIARSGGQGRKLKQSREERRDDSGERQENNNARFSKLGCGYNDCCNTEPGNTGCCNMEPSYVYNPYHGPCPYGYQIPTHQNAHSPSGGPHNKQIQPPPLENNNARFSKLGCGYNDCCNTGPRNTGCCNMEPSYGYDPYYGPCPYGYQIPTHQNAHSPPGGSHNKQMQQPPLENNNARFSKLGCGYNDCCNTGTGNTGCCNMEPSHVYNPYYGPCPYGYQIPPRKNARSPPGGAPNKQMQQPPLENNNARFSKLGCGYNDCYNTEPGNTGCCNMEPSYVNVPYYGPCPYGYQIPTRTNVHSPPGGPTNKQTQQPPLENNNAQFSKLGCGYNDCCNTGQGNTGCCNLEPSYPYDPYYSPCPYGYQIPTRQNTHSPPDGGPCNKQTQQPPLADKIPSEGQSFPCPTASPKDLKKEVIMTKKKIRKLVD